MNGTFCVIFQRKEKNTNEKNRSEKERQSEKRRAKNAADVAPAELKNGNAAAHVVIVSRDKDLKNEYLLISNG